MRWFTMLLINLVLLIVVATNQTVHAFETLTTAKGNELQSLLKRFTPYDRTYAIWQWTKGDDQAMEVQYSLKYIIYDCRGEGNSQLFGCGSGTSSLNFFFSYTGQFDFYVGTRPSGPVINRLSNPALHIAFDKFKQQEKTVNNSKEDITKDTNWFIDLSVEHRSNGQVVDPYEKDTDPRSPTYGQYKTQIEYDRGNKEYFDRISRGANYAKLTYFYSVPETAIGIEVSGKGYFTNESAVTWGKYAGKDINFADFDLVQIKYRDRFFQNVEILPTTIMALEYTVGEQLFATDSLDIFLTFPIISNKGGWNLPFFLKAHTGPMERLSDFSRPVKSIGAGFSFLY